MNVCTRCANENHEACDGGAWDEALKPTVCRCHLRYHHGRALKTAHRLATRRGHV